MPVLQDLVEETGTLGTQLLQGHVERTGILGYQLLMLRRG